MKPTTTKNSNNTQKNHKPSTRVRMKRKLKKMIKNLTSSKNSYNCKYSNGQVKPFGKKVNWYWDIRIWSPLIIIMMIICLNVNIHNDESNEIPVQDPAMEISTVPTEETEPALSPEERDIVALARLADTVGAGRNEQVKEIIMWVAINRVDDGGANGYGKPLIDEINRPKQWQQYDANGIYTEATYELAKTVYHTWETNGARPIYKDMLWFVLNGDGSITVRNRFGNEKNRSEATFGQ